MSGRATPPTDGVENHADSPETATPKPINPASKHYYQPTQDPQWVRVTYRITGLAVFLFILICVGFGILLRSSPDAFNTAVGYLQHPIGVFGCVVLFGAILFHALHAIRIALVDLLQWGARDSKNFVSLVNVVWVAIVISGAYLITRNTLLEMFGEP